MTKATSKRRNSIPESEVKQYEYVTRSGERRSIRVKHCTECGRPFFPARADALTDSDRCRKARQRRMEREAREAQRELFQGLLFNG